jgi:hypothetical protein
MSSFGLDLNALIAETGIDPNIVVKKAVLDIARSVIRKSPVDTGRFKGNWQLGVNSSPIGERDATDSSALGTARDSGPAMAQVIEKLPAQHLSNTYYITNNLPYAQALEDGHSQRQAPQGMVERTLIEFDAIFRDATS